MGAGMLHTRIVVALLLVLAGPAFADEREEVEDGLLEFELAVKYGKEEGERALGRFREEPAACHALVERGVRAGIQPTDTVQGASDRYLFKRAAERCAEYATWKQLVTAADVIIQIRGAHQTAHAIDPGDVKQEWVTGMRKIGEECLAKIDAMTKAGLRTDLVVQVNQDPLTIPAAADKWCGDLVRWSDKFLELTKVEDAKKAAALEELKAYWKKLKVGGDKLDLFVGYDGYAWYVNKGGYCTEVSGAQQAKASVLFHRLSDGEWSWTLRRYQFKGNKLVSTSERHFDTRGKASAGCK